MIKKTLAHHDPSNRFFPSPMELNNIAKNTQLLPLDGRGIITQTAANDGCCRLFFFHG